MTQSRIHTYVFPSKGLNGIIPIIYYTFGPLKSGIPAAVLIPAPVCTTTCLEALIHSASFSTLTSASDGSSNIYTEKLDKYDIDHQIKASTLNTLNRYI